MAYVSPTNIEALAQKFDALTFIEMMQVSDAMNTSIELSIEPADPAHTKPAMRLPQSELAMIFAEWARGILKSYETRSKGE